MAGADLHPVLVPHFGGIWWDLAVINGGGCLSMVVVAVRVTWHVVSCQKKTLNTAGGVRQSPKAGDTSEEGEQQGT